MRTVKRNIKIQRRSNKGILFNDQMYNTKTKGFQTINFNSSLIMIACNNPLSLKLKFAFIKTDDGKIIFHFTVILTRFYYQHFIICIYSLDTKLMSAESNEFSRDYIQMEPRITRNRGRPPCFQDYLCVESVKGASKARGWSRMWRMWWCDCHVRYILRLFRAKRTLVPTF